MNHFSSSSSGVFLSNLGNYVDEDVLYGYCAGWGEIFEFRLLREPVSRCPRGFAFVTYKQPASASKFLSSQPHFIGERKLMVRPSLENCEGNDEISLKGQCSSDLFVSYSRPTTSASSSMDCESLVAQNFNSNPCAIDITFGVSRLNEDDGAFNNGVPRATGYAIVSFASAEDSAKCLERGAQQLAEGGIQLRTRRLISAERELKRRKRLADEEAARQMALRGSEDWPASANMSSSAEDKEPVVFFQMPSLLSSAPKRRPQFAGAAPPPIKKRVDHYEAAARLQDYGYR